MVKHRANRLLAGALVILACAAFGADRRQAVEHSCDRGRPSVCLKRFTISLGDSFQYVYDQFEHLKHDPNGWNHNNRAWEPGKLTDFFSVSEASTTIDKNNQLNPSFFCSFDEQKRLRSFSASWLHDGEQSVAMKRTVLDMLFEKELTCMKGRSLDLEKDLYVDTYDGGDYVQEFRYDFTGERYWTVHYSIRMKD